MLTPGVGVISVEIVEAVRVIGPQGEGEVGRGWKPNTGRHRDCCAYGM